MSGCSSSRRSGRAAAQRLGRDPSTVHRELARCTGRADYDARSAHAWACARARRVRVSKLADDAVLAAAVNERLKLRWSPHAAAADLREAGMSVCAETIYRACYANDARSGLPAGSWDKLPRRCRRRGPRSVAQAQKPSPLGEYRRLADRRADVEDRSQPGHWDRDLIVGKANLTAAVTLAERTSRYCLTAALPDGYSAPQVAAAVTAALARQPRALVRTLTGVRAVDALVIVALVVGGVGLIGGSVGSLLATRRRLAAERHRAAGVCARGHARVSLRGNGSCGLATGLRPSRRRLPRQTFDC